MCSMLICNYSIFISTFAYSLFHITHFVVTLFFASLYCCIHTVNQYFELRRVQSGPSPEQYLQCSLDYCNAHADLQLLFCGGTTCRTREHLVSCNNHFVTKGVFKTSRTNNIYDCQQSIIPTVDCSINANTGHPSHLMLNACNNKFCFEHKDAGGATTHEDFEKCETCFNQWTSVHSSSKFAGGNANNYRGKYCKSRNTATCIRCGPGQYSSEDEPHFLRTCDYCVPGKVGRSNQCHECEKGEYMNEYGGSTCLTCSKGRFSDTKGNKECLECGAGMFSPKVVPQNENRFLCKQCVQGEFQDKTGAASCKQCAKGSRGKKVKGLSQSDACAACAAGQAQEQQGTNTCESCQKGLFSAQTGAIVCQLCPAGETNNMVQQTECEKCKRRTYLSEDMRAVDSKCLPCATATNSGSSVCSGCPLGKAGECTEDDCSTSSECELCTKGTYSIGGTETECKS